MLIGTEINETNPDIVVTPHSSSTKFVISIQAIEERNEREEKIRRVSINNLNFTRDNMSEGVNQKFVYHTSLDNGARIFITISLLFFLFFLFCLFLSLFLTSLYFPSLIFIDLLILMAIRRSDRIEFCRNQHHLPIPHHQTQSQNCKLAFYDSHQQIINHYGFKFEEWKWCLFEF